MFHEKHHPQEWQSPTKVVSRKLTIWLWQLSAVLGTLGSGACQRHQLVWHLNLHDWFWLHIFTLRAVWFHPFLVWLTLYWGPFLLITCYSLQCLVFWSWKPSLLSLKRLARLESSAPVLICWPVDLILSYCTLWINSLSRACWMSCFSRITFELYLPKICVSRGISLHLFWLKTCCFGVNGLILPSPKTECLETDCFSLEGLVHLGNSMAFLQCLSFCGFLLFPFVSSNLVVLK